jgi:hypothetical protein
VKTPRDGGEPKASRGDRVAQSDRALRADRAPRAGRPRRRPAPGISYVAVLQASGRALGAPRSRPRPLLITDGPFAETREHLG